MKIKDLNTGDTFTLKCDGQRFKVVHIAAQYKRGRATGEYYCAPQDADKLAEIERKKVDYPNSYLPDFDGRMTLNRNMLVIDVVESGEAPRMGFGKHKGKLVADVDKGYLIWALDNVTNLFSVREEKAAREAVK
jgi:hypothetical protein